MKGVLGTTHHGQLGVYPTVLLDEVVSELTMGVCREVISFGQEITWRPGIRAQTPGGSHARYRPARGVGFRGRGISTPENTPSLVRRLHKEWIMSKSKIRRTHPRAAPGLQP